MCLCTKYFVAFSLSLSAFFSAFPCSLCSLSTTPSLLLSPGKFHLLCLSTCSSRLAASFLLPMKYSLTAVSHLSVAFSSSVLLTESLHVLSKASCDPLPTSKYYSTSFLSDLTVVSYLSVAFSWKISLTEFVANLWVSCSCPFTYTECLSQLTFVFTNYGKVCFIMNLSSFFILRLEASL